MPKPPTDKITDRLKRCSHLPGASGESSRSQSPSVPDRYFRLARQVGGEVVIEAAGNYVLVKSTYRAGHTCGTAILDSPEKDAKVAAASFQVQDNDIRVNLDDLLFFDTETTGLGGTGAVAFLIGFGSLKSDGFEVRQYLLPDYDDEAGMLEKVLAEFSPELALVSYNGLAFDTNLLRDRMILNRVARKLPVEEHFDLLHSARRLFRRRLKDCSLTNIEEQLFGFRRQGDIPGYLVPSAYFEWLESEDASSVIDVLEHNRQDILSLYFLLKEIDQIFQADGDQLVHAEDIYSLSRLFDRRRQVNKVVENHRRLEQAGTGTVSAEIALFHAMAYKRAGDWGQAILMWQKLARASTKEGFWACLELAKYYEHRAKELPTALSYTRKAQKLSGMLDLPGDGLSRRRIRLLRKSGDTNLHS